MTINFERGYKAGRARDAEGASRTVAADEFEWIDIADPSDDELKRLSVRFAFHPLAIEDAAGDGHLPKAEPIAEDELFVIAMTARLERQELETGQIAVFVGDGHVVSVSRGGMVDTVRLKDELEKVPELMQMGVDYVLHGILSAAAGTFLSIVEKLDEEVTELERTIPDAALDQAKIVKLLTLRRWVKRLERMLKPMEEMARKLAAGDLPCIQPDLAMYFRDVVDQVQRGQAVCESIRDGLASVFEYSALLEQQRTGVVTKRLAAWAGILAVPTAIAGIYGMNFNGMPELAWTYGYPASLVGMLLVSVLLFWRFKRSGWL